MIPALAAALPPSLAPFTARLAVGAGRGAIRVADMVRSRSAFAEATGAFTRAPAADERAILSYWTQFYFAALIVPSVAALVRLRCVLPVALDALTCDLDVDGKVERFWLADAGRRLAADAPTGVSGEGMATLVALHLRPFIEGCAGWSGLSRRVLWCNAGTMLDFVIKELGIDAPSDAGERDEAPRARSHAEPLLIQPYHLELRGPTRKRVVCCLRFRLQGATDCGATCPMRARAFASPVPTRTQNAD